MYLKSIEVAGFKSFANKIVFEFHNGITGIVGPNGSGKSNVGDAVRWVLGEQSAKQLRGASMQDIIFSGTETRKPLSYAYVAITMDNSDHKLAVDYEEVTVARRVYRSGESEYLMNGSACRLKDVTELFYDTGIGKEGYSLIGQGQVERILNGKPDERRELFDEAAGIVKYKKRKAAAQKKLESEQENLVRVNDILSELERQVGPLEKQAEKARTYLKKKEELKTLDVNAFLLEAEQLKKEQQEVAEKYEIADHELKEASTLFEHIKAEYDRLEQSLTAFEEKQNILRDKLSESTLLKGKLEGQINVLNEQIRSAKMTDEHFKSRLLDIDREKAERERSLAEYEREREQLGQELAGSLEESARYGGELAAVQEEIRKCSEQIEQGKNEIIGLLNRKASVKAGQQRYDTMLEQINIRKAQLTKQLIDHKTQDADLENVLMTSQKKLAKVNETIESLKGQAAAGEKKERELHKKAQETEQLLEQAVAKFHKAQSRLEFLKNIAERYDGYGNSIRRVMEQRAKTPGIIGVVSDLIQVGQKFETAIETALGGRIQNIVTEDEQTAKQMIAFLKQNRYGRATFLPLTSVKGNHSFPYPDALKEDGVIGLANTLVTANEKYSGVLSYLLGRTVVVENIDKATALAKKYRYALSIVTLEGESLSPGGSMTGGAFKNTSSLLARNREIEELETSIKSLGKDVAVKQKDLGGIKKTLDDLAELAEKNRKELQACYIEQNTAQMNADRAKEQKDESEVFCSGLRAESSDLERQLAEIRENKDKIAQQMESAVLREEQIARESKELEKLLEDYSRKEESIQKEASAALLKEARLRQKAEFADTNLTRIRGELSHYDREKENFISEARTAKEDAEKKRSEIEEIQKTIDASNEEHARLSSELKDTTEQREQMQSEHKSFFQKREEISGHIAQLDREIFRLNSQKERLVEAGESRTNYMWQEYELTLHAAMELRCEEYTNLSELRKMAAAVKDEIRKLGDVNVNAIEDYKEVSERYEFLKTQHDDLVEAEKTLLGIIEELDTGMRKQFLEEFARIQREFDKVFKELFGGGRGALELVEDEDILECGIRIIAQPPGKRLQNMMQMSGGEKALTAISLLFAIQNLKPSPFCLLDEIEAALDDSNVDRFAKYLQKLTKNTQIIVITHRRGTMGAADRLYGITMQEKGVSTLVSVNLIENDLEQ